MSTEDRSRDWPKYAARMNERRSTSKRISVAKIRNVLSSPNKFEEWLIQHKSDAIVGDLYTPDDSPLANFLWETLGIYVLTADTIAYDRSLIAMPAWCRDLDAATGEYGETRSREDTDLTAGELVDLLRLSKRNH